MEPTPEDIASASPERPATKRPASDIHRLLPAAVDAEKGLLCSFLLAPNEIGSLCAEKGISADWMHLPAHSIILRRLIELWEARKPIDFISFTQSLRDLSELDQVGGAAYVTDLFAYLPTAANAAYYIEILQEKVLLRQIIAVCTEHAARGYDEQHDVPGLLDSLERKVLGIRRGDESTIRMPNTKEATMNALRAIQELYERRGSVGGIPTGFHKLDQMMGGLHAQELTIVAGRPGSGKSAIALNIAEHIALTEKRAVAFFSCEMSEPLVFQRLLCSRARVNIVSVRHGFLGERDFPALTHAASAVAESQICVCEAIGATYGAICAHARRLHQRLGLAAIFIDYAQLVRSISRQAQGSREREIAEVSAGFKNLAHELKLPVVLLAQLNRDVEKRSGRGEASGRPRLSDLRESGALEQDADSVLLVYRPEMYAESDDEKRELQGIGTLIVAKQRNGDLGDVPLTFLKEFTRWESAAGDAEEAATPELPMRDDPRKNRKSEG